MTLSIFQWIYLAGLFVGTTIRKAYSRHLWKSNYDKSQKPPLEIALLTIITIGMLALPMACIFTSALGFADYRPPEWIGWLGAVVFAVALWLLWRSHADLGLNFSPFLQIRTDHSLITTGVYSRIRHPMYSAHWLWALAQALLLHNWIAGPAFMITYLPLYFIRVPREEQMMLDRFGDDYRACMRRTGRLLPRFGEIKNDGI